MCERACLINDMRTSNVRTIFLGIIAMYFLKYIFELLLSFKLLLLLVVFEVVIFSPFKLNEKKNKKIFFIEFIAVQYGDHQADIYFWVHCTCICIFWSLSVLSQVICICHKWVLCLEFFQYSHVYKLICAYLNLRSLLSDLFACVYASVFIFCILFLLVYTISIPCYMLMQIQNDNKYAVRCLEIDHKCPWQWKMNSEQCTLYTYQ